MQVFRLALPIDLTSPHHLTISYRAAVLYEMWSHTGNMLLSPVSPPVWMSLLFTAKGVNNKYIQGDMDRSSQPCKKYRRHSKGLINCEMVLRHQKPTPFSCPNDLNYIKY